jgi:hypothetical protein
MANRTKWTPKKRAAFLTALGGGNTVTFAAERVGVTRQVAYRVREQDPTFKAEWEQAVEQGTEALEQEAKRRALEGWDEPVYQGGAMVGTVRKHSDTLLIFLLKGRKPATYRDNATVRHEGAIGVQIYLPERQGD